MAIVELTNISKRYNIYDRPVDRLKELVLRNRRCYHKEFWALRNINLSFEPGTTTALLGANGSGKSTLLQVIANVLQPTEGRVSVNGRVTAILELGAGFQPNYSGRENVLVNGMILGIPQDEMLAKMESIAEFAEIGDFFDQPVKTYSSGMIVRLAFAAAISVNPEILLVDEALAVGDYRFQQKCVERIERLQEQNKTIIFVSHDLAAIRRFCHQAVLLDGGRVLESGTVARVLPRFEEMMDATGVVAPKVFTQPAVTG